MEAAGPRVASPAVGDLVVLSWLAPCHLCVECQRGQPWLCTRTRALEHRNVFEAIGLVPTIEQSLRLLRPGGTAVIVGMAPFGQQASFDAFGLADRSLRVVGSNYGSTIAVSDFPRYASLANAGRLPIERLVDAVVGPDEVNDALSAVRRGESVRRVLVR